MRGVAAIVAAQAQETVRQDAAFEEGFELVFHKLRQVDASSGLSLLEAGRGMLLHEAVWRGLFRAVAVVVDRGAVEKLLAVGSCSRRWPR